MRSPLPRVSLLSQLIPTTLPIAAPSVDVRVLLFAEIGLTAVTGIAVGPGTRHPSRRQSGPRRPPRRLAIGRRPERAPPVGPRRRPEIVASVVLLFSARTPLSGAYRSARAFIPDSSPMVHLRSRPICRCRSIDSSRLAKRTIRGCSRTFARCQAWPLRGSSVSCRCPRFVEASGQSP